MSNDFEKIKSNTGYKTKKSSKVGPFVKVGYSLITDKSISPPAKLVYACLKMYENSLTKISTISMDAIVSKFKYSKTTVNKAIRDLESHQIIEINSLMSRAGKGKRFNVYKLKFVDDGMFAMITASFLESELLSPRDKEFIVLLFPYIMDNNAIGSLKTRIDEYWISEQTGLSLKVVNSRIKSLKKKGLMHDYNTKKNTAEITEFVGFKIDLNTIMIDSSKSIMKNRNALKDLINETE